jgi:N-formylglutamate amidohydrolase
LKEINFNQLVEFHQGNLPLIITVPHGGSFKYESLPDREDGILGIDSKTIEIALQIIQYLKKYNSTLEDMNLSPSYVISLIHRSKIDFNRDEFNAFNQNSNLAKNVYNYYHQKIAQIIQNNLDTFNSSLLIDIHGFESDKRPEGYRDVDIVLGSNNLKSILGYSVPKKNWGKNIRGKLVKALNRAGILVAPGHHLRREYVLTGGYTTSKYGASNIVNSQSIQIEFSDRVRIHNKTLKDLILKTLAQTLVDDYLLEYL